MQRLPARLQVRCSPKVHAQKAAHPNPERGIGCAAFVCLKPLARYNLATSCGATCRPSTHEHTHRTSPKKSQSAPGTRCHLHTRNGRRTIPPGKPPAPARTPAQNASWGSSGVQSPWRRGLPAHGRSGA